MSSEEHKQKIWNFIKDIKVGMLVTSSEGVMHSRPMHLLQDDYDGTLWFFTQADDPKVIEINRNPNICISFSNHEDDLYVSLTGIAKLIQDSDLIDKFWNPFVASWFPKGKSDPNVALLEIDINEGEHWNANNNKMIQLYKIVRANITGDKPDLGENKKFG